MTVALTWIGQAGFLLRTPVTRLALDPFLSDHPDRRFPAPVGVDDLIGTELVPASHEHLTTSTGPPSGPCWSATTTPGWWCRPRWCRWPPRPACPATAGSRPGRASPSPPGT